MNLILYKLYISGWYVSEWASFFFNWVFAKIWTLWIRWGRYISVISDIDERFQAQNTELSGQMFMLMQDSWYPNLAYIFPYFIAAYQYDCLLIFSISINAYTKNCSLIQSTFHFLFAYDVDHWIQKKISYRMVCIIMHIRYKINVLSILTPIITVIPLLRPWNSLNHQTKYRFGILSEFPTTTFFSRVITVLFDFKVSH